MSPLEMSLEAFASQVSTQEGVIQFAIIVAGLGLGWLSGGVLRRRVAARELWKFGSGGFDRVAFPLAALAIIWGMRLLVRKVQATPFVDLAIALLAAFAVIRFAVYVLRHVLPEGALRRGTERTIATLMWAGVALHLTGLLPEVWEALESVAFTVGDQRITLLLVMQGLVSVAITLAISLWLANLVEGRVLATERLALSTRVVVAKLVRAAAFLLAILVALPIVGIDITALSVFGGALGVGLGFGLQKIASNYVSGFIILLDRSIRIGDFVAVDNRQGVVKAIESRYTVIRSLDGTESIIPNETMITQSVTNHSYTDRQVLLRVKVSVGYASDIDRVFELLLEAAKRQPRVLDDPAPAAWITALGDNGVEIELGLWIADPDKGQLSLRGAILKDVLRALRAEGIEIPFPQRDVRLVGQAPDSPGP
ncbi:MAG TPA: mechanosensitive ion channel [Usitatibacteraceae bacterium]|nr:mechanosensitive ion channel [Usitatibacteraceae bacterium]